MDVKIIDIIKQLMRKIEKENKMKEFMFFGHTFREIVPTLIKLGFVIGLIIGVMLLLKY